MLCEYTRWAEWDDTFSAGNVKSISALSRHVTFYKQSGGQVLSFYNGYNSVY